MNIKDVELAYNEESVAYNDVRTFKHGTYRFVKKEQDEILYQYGLESCELVETARGDKMIRIIVNNECVEKLRYAIIEQFHEGVWLTKIYRIDERGDIINV